MHIKVFCTSNKNANSIKSLSPLKNNLIHIKGCTKSKAITLDRKFAIEQLPSVTVYKQGEITTFITSSAFTKQNYQADSCLPYQDQKRDYMVGLPRCNGTKHALLSDFTELTFMQTIAQLNSEL